MPKSEGKMSFNTFHMEDLSIENNDEAVEDIQNQNSVHLNEFFKKYFQYSRKLKHDGFTKIKDNEMITNANCLQAYQSISFSISSGHGT